MRYGLALAATVIGTLTCTAAFAQQGQQRSPEQMAAAFDQADSNRDLKLDYAEWKALLPPRMTAGTTEEQLQTAFARRDRDHDKFLTKEEFMAQPARAG